MTELSEAHPLRTVCAQTLGLLLSMMHTRTHIRTWEVEAHTAGPHLTVEAKAMRLEWAGGLRKQRSVWQDQAAAGEGTLRLEAPLSPHTLLISLTPAGEAFAGRRQEGSLVTFGSPILSGPALLLAPSGGGQRLWPGLALPSCWSESLLLLYPAKTPRGQWLEWVCETLET